MIPELNKILTEIQPSRPEGKQGVALLSVSSIIRWFWVRLGGLIHSRELDRMEVEESRKQMDGKS